MIDSSENNCVIVNLVSTAPLRKEAIEGIVHTSPPSTIRFTTTRTANELSFGEYQSTHRGGAYIAYPVHAALSKIALASSGQGIVHLAVDSGKFIPSKYNPVFFQRPKTLREGVGQIVAVVEALNGGRSVSVSGVVAKNSRFAATAISARPFRLVDGVDIVDLSSRAITQFAVYWFDFLRTGNNQNIRPGALSLEHPIYLASLAAGSVLTRMSNTVTPPHITDDEVLAHTRRLNATDRFVPLSSYAGGCTNPSVLKHNPQVKSITDEIQGAPQDLMVSMVRAILSQMFLPGEFTQQNPSATMSV